MPRCFGDGDPSTSATTTRSGVSRGRRTRVVRAVEPRGIPVRASWRTILANGARPSARRSPFQPAAVARFGVPTSTSTRRRERPPNCYEATIAVPSLDATAGSSRSPLICAHTPARSGLLVSWASSQRGQLRRPCCLPPSSSAAAFRFRRADELLTRQRRPAAWSTITSPIAALAAARCRACATPAGLADRGSERGSDQSRAAAVGNEAESTSG